MTTIDEQVNELGQPIGPPVPGWQPALAPPMSAMEGRLCRVEPLDIERHAGDLFAAYAEDSENRIWTYLPYGPFQTEAAFCEWMKRQCLGADPLFHAIIDKQSGKASGLASYARITPKIGVIEVGHINYALRLQRTSAATEGMFLMMRRVFAELGYRRYEWKCDALNIGSRKAAERLGFRFEGMFRQATIYKGRNRDTAWYSVIDKEWPQLNSGFTKWLAPQNFDSSGRQRKSLSQFIKGARTDRRNKESR